MRASMQILIGVGAIALASPATAAFDDLPASKKVGYTALAVVENVVPVVSTLAAPRCLQGYVACKLTFAALSVLLAGEQILMSGGADLQQTRALLHRGIAGDWYVNPRQAAGEQEVQVLPDPPPPTAPGSTDADALTP